MRARKAWILGGIAAVALGVGAYILTRGSDGSGRKGTTDDPGQSAGTRDGGRDIPPIRRGSGSGVVRNTDVAPPDPGTPDIDREFEAQARDEAWATGAEAELRRRLEPLAGLGAQVDEIVCRSDRCRVTIESTTARGLGEALTKLGEPGLVVDYASQMIQTAVEPMTADRERTAVYLVFER